MCRFLRLCNAFHILLLGIVFIKKITNQDLWFPTSTSMSCNALTSNLVDVLSSSFTSSSSSSSFTSSSSRILVTATKAHCLPILCKSETSSGLVSAKTNTSPGNVL
ncbi:hypothetical protein CIPAW_05G204900 [Carya illinoinensis]|uniref:Secreted protein n=1 Tax=Carya illinoinensis TaxID=32201 RepID=A0A8T1QM21_CARIL|nr:hypothetical protein CIPAW_05G204900 [Carya illinoinensis]